MEIPKSRASWSFTCRAWLLVIERIFYAAGDVLRHTVTVDYSGQPYVTRHFPPRGARLE
ncbi:hypothetical protein OG215_40720 (plasmid) [Streptomyces globisporus]|uniref:hypothetical protein n=1 Tax=Streptomyces globisporus TaxID=1908 RepID=UPI002F90D1CF|nr:hypothetical protein OG215_40720 [Streptomyces globisporus]